MPYVSRQLQLLWGKKMVRILFSEMFTHVKSAKETAQRIQTTSPSKGMALLDNSSFHTLVVLSYMNLLGSSEAKAEVCVLI